MGNGSHRTFPSGFPGRCKRSGSQSRLRIRWTHVRNLFGDSQRINAFGLWSWKRLLKVPWTARSNQSILKEINPEYSLPRTDAEAEDPILWSPDLKSWLTGKDPDAGKDWRQEEKGPTEDEMFREHHQLTGSGSEQTLWDGEGLVRLMCCSPWGHKEWDLT